MIKRLAAAALVGAVTGSAAAAAGLLTVAVIGRLAYTAYKRETARVAAAARETDQGCTRCGEPHSSTQQCHDQVPVCTAGVPYCTRHQDGRYSAEAHAEHAAEAARTRAVKAGCKKQNDGIPADTPACSCDLDSWQECALEAAGRAFRAAVAEAKPTTCYPMPTVDAIRQTGGRPGYAPCEHRPGIEPWPDPCGACGQDAPYGVIESVDLAPVSPAAPYIDRLDQAVADARNALGKVTA